MPRSTRMFEIIQLLRSRDRPVTAQMLAEELEVTKRTVYRDIAALQAMRVPIEGEAGIGYIMRPGFDLPPLMFTSEEVESIVVGLALLGRTGDAALQDAAASVGRKIATILPGGDGREFDNWPLLASAWNQVPISNVDPKRIREAIRDAENLHLDYIDVNGQQTQRTVVPLALIYYTEALVLAAWCELRAAFRHFRLDRMRGCENTGDGDKRRAAKLRRLWQEEFDLP